MLSPAEAKAMVEKHGSARMAADILGIPRSTFRHWLYPERGRVRSARWRKENPEAKRADNARHYRENPLYHQQRTSLYRARKAVEAARQKAEELDASPYA